jgi:FAD/FMN-containing dehydrogenase
MLPRAVIFPKSTTDIRSLVRFVALNKQIYPNLAITARGAGTDMTGGAISNSLILDMTKYFTKIGEITEQTLNVEPGVFARNIEPLLESHNLFLGSMPASRQWCTVGGIVANNAGGEQSLRFGNTERIVQELRVILADGREYIFNALNRRQLKEKLTLTTFEGAVYRSVFNLIEENYDLIRNARPKVNKNSMGYNLWSVWDRELGIFNLAPLFTGSQGTLGIITNITFQLQQKAPSAGVLVLYLDANKPLGDIIATISKHNPATFEGFDQVTFELGIKHFSLFKKQLGAKEWAKQQASLLGSVARFQGHLPQMVLMVEFEGASTTEVTNKIAVLQQNLAAYKLRMEIVGSEEESSRFWQIRRASFQLLRKRIHGKYAAPFIDDLTVQPRYLPDFLPKLRKIIRKYNLPATIAGHFGDGNLHIIPLVDIKSPSEQLKLEPVLREILPLVQKYGGTLAGEHNDGMVRGPWLPAVFGNEMYQLFRRTKEIFDPMYIFNPHKKTDASWDFSMKHIRTTNNDS